MLPVSAMSAAANKLRNLLLDRIDDLDDVKRIRIGHPKDTFEDMEKHKDQNHLNLFFYNVSYDGYPADGLSEDPFYVRLHCLITPVGAKKEGSPSAGENDLRLIGEVMRVLHEQPVISVDDGNNSEIAQLQIVPHPLNLDDLNHIWSTQGDTAYRLSVAYEMSLAPIPLAVEVERSPLTGDPQLTVWGAMERRPEKEKEGMISYKPVVEYLEIDTDSEDWMPHICLVEHIDASHKELHYVFKVEGNLNEEMDVLIAGRNNGKVKLVWNVWRRKTDNSIVAWKEDIPDSVLPVKKEVKDDPGSSDPFFPNRIDPNDIDSRRIVKVKLPDDIKESDTKTWQAMLHAIHEWNHEEPADSGEFVTTLIKSNSVLLYGDGS